VTSNINYLSINENFPVAGEDNDTQTFRDNFDTIKTSLRSGQEEITALQANTAGLQLVETENGSDFGGREISNAILRNTLIKSYGGGVIPGDVTTLTIDYENGGYQKFQFAGNINIDFQNFPDNASIGGVGKVTLELTADNVARTLTLISSGGVTYRRNATFPSPFVVTSQTNPIIIEVWRRDANNIFLNYLGQFTSS
jgi:hypothetical protein